MLLYGPQFRINYCPPGNIGNWSLQHSPESWKYWKTNFFDSVLPWKYWKTYFLEFLISWTYWKSVFSHNLRFFQKKARAKISRRMHRRMSRDLSHETDSGPKTKTVSDPNFQVTPTTATATTARRQLSHLARPLDHHAQGANIPFGVNPSLRHDATCFT